MESALKGLVLAAGVILTCIVVGIGFYMAREAKATAFVTAENLSELKQEIKEQDIMKYHEREVSGSDVMNLIKRKLLAYEDTDIAPLYIEVQTKEHQEKYVNNKYLSKLYEADNDHYINPIGCFYGKVCKDENDVIIGVLFEQK